MTEQVAQELSLTPAGEQPLTIMTFGSNKEQSRICTFARLNVVLKDGGVHPLTLFAVPLICEPLTCQPVSFCQEGFGHLSHLPLADPSDGSSHLDIDILIGSDQYWELVTGETSRGDSGPVAISTKLGWVLSGPIASSSPDTSSTCLVTHTLRVDGLSQDTRILDDRLKSFWELESFGISGVDRSIYDEFGSSVRFVDGRYEVELPWKDAHPTIPDNYRLCVTRLNGLLKRLKHDPEILQEYNSIISDQLERGIVEIVDPSNSSTEKIHYLPHHAVVRRNKETTKVRVVYDASAHSDGPSLNECLHVGPKFDQNILDILLRFRVHQVAVTADVEKAFLMVSVAEKDRDVLRFLWVEDVLAEHPSIVELRFTRVVFGVSPSPFLLNATIRHHLEKYREDQPDVVKKLCNSFYVDDLVTGAKDEDHARELFSNAKMMLKEGGFNLRKFNSNSATLQARINRNEMDVTMPSLDVSGIAVETEETYASSKLAPGQEISSGEQKVLGVRWNASSDCFVIDFTEIASAARVLEPTKRNIVSLVGRFYDPFGIISPVVVRFKILFQDLCEAKLEWDQPLPDGLLRKWHLLRSSLEEGQPVSIPRYYFEAIPNEFLSISLCGFCDASLKAYAGVIYLLVETTAGFFVKFVAAKTRVSPLKEQTIPRLELLSTLLLTRLIVSITQSLETELQLSPPRCFTDSTVALCWIKGTDKSWKPFIQNRVDEIRRSIPTEAWHHCPGKNNPADLPSRGLAPLELSVNILWRDGPDWLRNGEFGDSVELQPNSECLAEMRVKDRKAVHGLLVASDTTGLSGILRCEDFSFLNRLFSVTALVVKFCNTLLDKIRPEGASSEILKRLSIKEMWILECQRMVLADRKFQQWKKQLDLFQDASGVWRCRGRIQNADVPYGTRHPALLHKDHPLTKLLIRKAHSRVLHNGVKETLAELRSNFWIVRGRSVVKSLIHQCSVCRRYEGGSYHTPPPPPLPTFRVEEAPPFSFTGVDFAGPLYVRSDGGATRKVWICLYTCCVVRAIHLDLVPDMSTPAFLRSFRRFTARRGLPCKMLSDNGKTFRAAAKLVKEVKWIFNVPKAPWWGGVFERMVRCTKRCLRKVIGQARFSQDELLTALIEVEMVVNSRPLSYMAADDLEEPLTPSHLIVGRRLMSVPDIPDTEPEEYNPSPDALTRRAKYLSSTIDRFWERWRKEYLLELRVSHKQQKRSSSGPHVSVGDIVTIHADGQPRGMWHLGRVEKLLTGNDGENRGAILRVAGGGKRAKYLSRPIQRLYPLEMHSRVEQPLNTDLDESSPDEPQEESSAVRDEAQPLQSPRQGRTTRAAAFEARDRLLALALEDVDH